MHWPSILAYMISSFSIVIFNKIVLTIFEFRSVPFIMFCQSIFTVSVLLIRINYIQKPGLSILKICVLNILNIFFGLSGSATVNVAMFSALRRISIIMILIGQWGLLEKKPSCGVFISVIFMILGALVAASDDLSFNIGGYLYVTLNNILTAACQIETKRAILDKWTKTSILFWTSFLTLLIFGLQILYYNSVSFRAWENPGFRVAFFFSICLGFIINWSASWTIEMNDALTLSVAGSTKSAILGLIVCIGIFDNTYIFSWMNFIGLQISAISSLCYIYAKNTENKLVENAENKLVENTENKLIENNV